MTEIYIFNGVDLRTATIYDLADVLPQYPVILIDSEIELDEQEQRIFNLITYADTYNLTELSEKLKELYKKY